MYTHTHKHFTKKNFQLDSIDDGGGGGGKKINDQLQIDEFVIRLNENVCIIHKQQQAIFSGSIFFLIFVFLSIYNCKENSFSFKISLYVSSHSPKKKN